MPNQQLRIDRKGRTVRLVAPEGTFSYYHPTKLFTGFSWDALSAAGLFISRRLSDIVVLGLGGGTCARQCRVLYPDARIVGVEIDLHVLNFARREFSLDAIEMEVILSSGQDYLRSTRRQFDLIIDDMWPRKPYSPKPMEADQSWINLICSHLRKDGVYAINLYDRDEYPPEISAVSSILRRRFASLWEVRPPYGQTTPIIASNVSISHRNARERIRCLHKSYAVWLDQLTFRNLSYHSMGD